MSFLIGIDGGASKTVCLVADSEGGVVGHGGGGPANSFKAGLYAAKTSLCEATDAALSEAGIGAADVSVVCAGISGMSRPRERDIFGQIFKERFPRADLVLEDDAYIALAGATEGRPGIISIAGTGSIALGIDTRGNRARCGGWGHLLGDEGSGYDLARKGLNAALRAHDKLGPSTALAEKILAELYLDSLEELIPALYDDRMTSARIAALFPLVTESAREGDRVCIGLLERAARHHFESVRTVAMKLRFRDLPIPVATSGGVWPSAPHLSLEFERLLDRECPDCKRVLSRHPPEMGAILVARARARGEKFFFERAALGGVSRPG